MEFDPDAKARTVSAVLNTIKWAIWGITTALVLLFANTYKADGSEDDKSLMRFIFIVAVVGYLGGYFVKKYHDSIIRKG